MTNATAREVIADYFDRDRHDLSLPQADAILSALSAAGYVVVPKAQSIDNKTVSTSITLAAAEKESKG